MEFVLLLCFEIGFKTHVKVSFFFLNSETDLFCTELFLGKILLVACWAKVAFSLWQ